MGVTYLGGGDNHNVEISVQPEPSSGDRFIVMLHRDVDENRDFDFAFVDEVSVVDRAVFEGRTMIAHAIPAPWQRPARPVRDSLQNSAIFAALARRNVQGSRES